MDAEITYTNIPVNKKLRPNVVHASDPSPWEAEASDLLSFQASAS